MSASICPTCNRRLPSPKATLDKRIVEDQKKVHSAIRACESALMNHFFADIRDAIQDEIVRLNRALTDYRLLWSLYRRKDKKTPYYAV